MQQTQNGPLVSNSSKLRRKVQLTKGPIQLLGMRATQANIQHPPAVVERLVQYQNRDRKEHLSRIYCRMNGTVLYPLSTDYFYRVAFLKYVDALEARIYQQAIEHTMAVNTFEHIAMH